MNHDIRNIDGVTIWRRFKLINEYREVLNRRNCWMCCDDCKKRWSDVEPATEMVHMKIRKVSGKQVQRFICDNCEKKRTEDEQEEF